MDEEEVARVREGWRGGSGKGEGGTDEEEVARVREGWMRKWRG